MFAWAVPKRRTRAQGDETSIRHAEGPARLPSVFGEAECAGRLEADEAGKRPLRHRAAIRPGKRNTGRRGLRVTHARLGLYVTLRWYGALSSPRGLVVPRRASFEDGGESDQECSGVPRSARLVLASPDQGLSCRQTVRAVG
ncbi:MAG: hypothetical protein AMXMBFR81_22890 [Chthonomonas sp.]